MKVRSVDGAWDFSGREELETFLDEHNLEPADICLVGSISLSARGLRKHGDIDVAIHPEKRDSINVDVSEEFVGVTEERYSPLDLTDSELIENEAYHDEIDGFKIVRPEITFSFKKWRGLPKDEDDVDLLEDYALGTVDWDWNLYRSDYTEPPASLVSRGLQSLRNDGLLVTVDKILGLVSRTLPATQKISRLLPLYDVRTPYHTFRKVNRQLSTSELLNRQYVEDRFTGFDVVACWILLQAEGDGLDVKLDVERLEIDKDAFQECSDQTPSSIRVSQKHRILDAPESAHALDNGPGGVEITCRFSRHMLRDEPWLRSQGLTDDEIEYLEQKRLEMFEDHGVLFYAVFWPPAHDYFDEMEAVLRKKAPVCEIIDIEVDDIKTFTKEVYQAQTVDAPAWSINWKAEQMASFPPKVRIAKLELPNPRLRNEISREMEMIKNDVRHEFVDNFPDEYYLALIHATDNYDDNLKFKRVLETHI